MGDNRTTKRWGFPLKFIVTEKGVRRAFLLFPWWIVPWSKITGIDIYDSSGIGVQRTNGKAFRMELEMPEPRLVLERIRSCAPPQISVSFRPPATLRQLPRGIAAVVALGSAGVLGVSYVILREPLLFVGVPAGLLGTGYFALRWRRALRTGSSRNPPDAILVMVLSLMPPLLAPSAIDGDPWLALWAMPGCMAGFFLGLFPLQNPTRTWLRKLWRERAIAEGLLPPEQAAEPDES